MRISSKLTLESRSVFTLLSVCVGEVNGREGLTLVHCFLLTAEFECAVENPGSLCKTTFETVRCETTFDLPPQ